VIAAALVRWFGACFMPAVAQVMGGFRGCNSMVQVLFNGCAHLINSDGTDTMSAAYYAQVRLREVCHFCSSSQIV
jgi:hypothetical protein